MSDGPWIVKLIDGVVGLDRHPELVALLGKYVLRYEPHLAKQGKTWLRVTDDPAQALAFSDPQELHQWYTQSIGTRPWDGKPDRPITVFHIQVERRRDG